MSRRDYQCVERKVGGYVFRIVTAPTLKYEIDDQLVPREVWLDALHMILSHIERPV